jgi:hypothetical protein
MNEIDLPCVLSIQTGINEPRYVGMRGIRQVASLPIPTFGAADLGVNGDAGAAAAKVKRDGLFRAAVGQRRRDARRQHRSDRRQPDRVAESQRRAELNGPDFCLYRPQRRRGRRFGSRTGGGGRKDRCAQSPTAVVTGWGPDCDAVCESLRASSARFGKSPTNRWLIRTPNSCGRRWCSVLPAGCIVLVPHSHFGTDLSPGLSIKMNAAYVPDVLDIEGGRAPR